jgi:hypothetical protein
MNAHRKQARPRLIEMLRGLADIPGWIDYTAIN